MSSRFWRARRCRALRLTRILREASAVHVYLTAIPAAFAAHSNCRIAVLYSGHVRSFAHPRVHESHRRLLIEPLEAECKVDVFMHVSGDTRPMLSPQERTQQQQAEHGSVLDIPWYARRMRDAPFSLHVQTCVLPSSD